jgi:phosphoribosyl 1,2-cyclic phosphodiesterase
MFFPAQHDVETYGFLLEHPECGKVLFATDTYYIKYKFQGLNNLILETNYSKEIIKQKFEQGGINSFLKDRVLRSHFSLENAIEFLNENDLSQVNTINLIHLSSSNSNAIQFQQKVSEATGKLVTVLEKGLTINFDKTPF